MLETIKTGRLTPISHNISRQVGQDAALAQQIVQIGWVCEKSGLTTIGIRFLFASF